MILNIILYVWASKRYKYEAQDVFPRVQNRAVITETSVFPTVIVSTVCSYHKYQSVGDQLAKRHERHMNVVGTW